MSAFLTEASRRQTAIKSFLGVNSKVQTFGIITGENPMGKSLSPQENRKRNEMLIGFLRSRQYIYYPVKGKYGNKENTFMVYNVSLADMKTIGRTFDQESFIYAEITQKEKQPLVTFSYYQKDYGEDVKISDSGQKIKPIERDYKFIESKSVYCGLDSDTDDYFTAIGRNFKFSIPFDIFSESIIKFNDFILERCNKHKEYEIKYNRLLAESLENNRTDKSRFVKRSQLYGTNYEKFLK